MSNLIKAKFDSVHDTQQLFRKLVDAFSRPGKKVNLTKWCQEIHPPDSFSNVFAGVAFTLLDQEVSFRIVGEESNTVEEYLKTATFSQPEEVEEADYHFVTSMEKAMIEPYLFRLKSGTLYQPHQSATVFLLVDSFEEEGEHYTLTGPGIKDTAILNVQGLEPKWIEIRNLITAEFPTGIDLCLISRDGQLISIPRSIKVMRG